jgi:DNA-binding XRE family transcriptional regulator
MAILETRIREYRFKADMKQEELANKVGVRRETIVHLEAGRYNPSLKLAYDIARVFNVSIEEIFRYKEPDK